MTFTGPSGTGKTSIITELFSQIPGLTFVSSYTTRQPRPSDFPVEFRHVSQSQFEEIEKKGEFLWSVEVHGNQYGTRKQDVDDALSSPQFSVMTLVPTATAKLFAYTKGNIIPLFILPPDREVLRARLSERGEKEEAISRRIEDCASWVSEAKSSSIPYRFVSNEGTVKKAAEEAKKHLA